MIDFQKLFNDFYTPTLKDWLFNNLIPSIQQYITGTTNLVIASRSISSWDKYTLSISHTDLAVDMKTQTLPVDSTMVEDVFNFTWQAGTGSFSPMYFWGICQAGTADLIQYDFAQ